MNKLIFISDGNKLQPRAHRPTWNSLEGRMQVLAPAIDAPKWRISNFTITGQIGNIRIRKLIPGKIA